MAVELDLSQDRITAYLSGEIDHHIAAGCAGRSTGR